MNDNENRTTPAEDGQTSGTDNITFMEDGEAVRPRRLLGKIRLTRRLIILAVLALVILFALIVTASAGWLSAERISLALYDNGRGRTVEQNLPITVNGLKVSGMDRIGYCFGVLDERKYTIYSPACNELYTYTHSMASPVTVTNDRRVLIYERGNFTITAFSRKGVLWNKTMDTEVISADMNRKGQVVVAAGDERYLSRVTLLDNEGTTLQTWYSADRYAVDAAISPDGGSYAVALVRVVNGEEQAVISLFKRGDEQPRKEYPFDAETVFDVRYLPDGTLMAVGTAGVAFFDDDMTMTGSYRFGNEELTHYTDDGRHAVLLFAPHAGEDAGTLVRVDRKGEKAGTASLADVDFLTADNNGTVLACHTDGVTRLTFSGSTCTAETLPADEDMGGVLRALLWDDRAMVLSIGGIYDGSIKTETDSTP